MYLRNVCPDDYKRVIRVINDWWGGRHMSDMLPKLFFVHFCETSFIAEENEEIIGFLIGFLSQTRQQEAYIHFAGVNPKFRRQGVGRALYGRFLETVKTLGRWQIRCVTSPVNQQSIAYHLSIGFQIEPGDQQAERVSYHHDYDGVGEHRVLLIKQL